MSVAMNPKARGRLASSATHCGRACYLRLVLWPDQGAMASAVRRKAARGASALFVPGPGARGKPTSARIGDVHLVAGRWDLEVVAHEVQHALHHRQALHGPEPGDVAEQVEALSYVGGRADEELAYEAGRWIAGLVRWLASVDREIPQLPLMSTGP